MMSGEKDVFAAVCPRLDGPSSLEIRRLPHPEMTPSAVRVKISAAGLNFPDLLMTRGAYQYKPPLPFVPGMEAAGIITEVGPNVEGLAINQCVMVGARNGLFATEIVCPVADVTPAPVDFTMEESACFLVATHTAYHALVDRAQMRSGETVLVLGAGGGIALAAIEIAHLLGARVIAAASSERKLEIAMQRGAD